MKAAIKKGIRSAIAILLTLSNCRCAQLVAFCTDAGNLETAAYSESLPDTAAEISPQEVDEQILDKQDIADMTTDLPQKAQGNSEETATQAQDTAIPWLPAKQSTISGTPLHYGAALAELAQQEYEQYGWTACGSRYWDGHELNPWSADFVYWCGEKLGLTGEGKLFGSKIHSLSDLAQNLLDGDAAVYYPGDGTVPQKGDIVFWWCGKRPGRKDDGMALGEIMHTGIVISASDSIVSVIEGSSCSWAPTKSVLAKNTYSMDAAMVGNVYIYMFLCPDYPVIYSEHDAQKIQNALVRLLYQNAGGRVSCGFDGYQIVEGRHEGIDFYAGAGTPVYAVAKGKIIKVSPGGGETPSIICIYDEIRNRTVVYLHTAPSESLSVGQSVEYGDYLGTEAARGADSTHTHIEVVNGKSYCANYSKNGFILDNEEPYRYWAIALSEAVVSLRRF